MSSQPKAPNALLMLLEGRAPWEFAAMLAANRWLNTLPAGDGHPVLVFPGLGAPDFTTLPLRKFLRARGYEPYTWEQGFNLGPRKGVLEGCQARADEIFKKHQQPLSLVGWSLGGIYAREIAKLLPQQQTRCVVTLGTPFGGHPRATNAWWLYEKVSGQKLDDEALMAQVRQAPDVPTTSIYSRSDGVVSWQCSLNDEAPHTENVRVNASHFGLGMNPLALYVLADRLAQQPGEWQRFSLAGKRKWFFKTT